MIVVDAASKGLATVRPEVSRRGVDFSFVLHGFHFLHQ
jgi:hypothetical protein